MNNEENNINMQNNNINNSSTSIISENYKSLYHSLGQIQQDSLEVFNFELYNFKSKNILYKMLLMENKLFYQKIQFLESLKSMIQAIDYFQEKVDNNILGYISNLLRIFQQMIIIISSFHLISKYPNYSINLNVEIVFLEIVYRAMDIFYFIIKNSGMTFKEIKEFMENVFLEIQHVLTKFQSEKNIYIFISIRKKYLYFQNIIFILCYKNFIIHI